MEIYSCAIITIFISYYLKGAIIRVINLQKNMAPKIIIRGMFSNQIVGRSRLSKAARGFDSQARVVGSISKRCGYWNILLTRRVGVRVLMVPWVRVIIPCRKRGSTRDIPPVCRCRRRGSNRAFYAFFSHISLFLTHTQRTKSGNDRYRVVVL